VGSKLERRIQCAAALLSVRGIEPWDRVVLETSPPIEVTGETFHISQGCCESNVFGHTATEHLLSTQLPTRDGQMDGAVVVVIQRVRDGPGIEQDLHELGMIVGRPLPRGGSGQHGGGGWIRRNSHPRRTRPDNHEHGSVRLPRWRASLAGHLYHRRPSAPPHRKNVDFPHELRQIGELCRPKIDTVLGPLVVGRDRGRQHQTKQQPDK
jgi:hypothetical protein